VALEPAAPARAGLPYPVIRTVAQRRSGVRIPARRCRVACPQTPLNSYGDAVEAHGK
jgi:hypothetical protein